jgi:hypothetical protein
MRFRLQLMTISDDGSERIHPVAELARGCELRPETIHQINQSFHAASETIEFPNNQLETMPVGAPVLPVGDGLGGLIADSDAFQLRQWQP